MSARDRRHHRLELAAGPLHVVEIGSADGAPVIFLHGVLANARLWFEMASRLSDGHRCLLLELPLGAHPEPMADDADLSPAGIVRMVVEALDALNIETATLVGNDSGGALCQMIVAAHPERVRAVVLTSCDAYDVWLPALFKPFELAAFVPGALFVIAKLLRLRAIRSLPFAFGWLSRRMPDELAASFVAPLAASRWARRDLGKFLRGISPRLTLRAAESFPSFDRPVLVIWSRDDRFFAKSLAERLAADFPRATLELVDDAYTFSPVDAPEVLARRVGAFLAGLS